MAENDKLKDHNYDGIQEYDNPMPGWWSWIFILSGVYGVIYLLGIHVYGFVNTYEQDLVSGQAELQAIRAQLPIPPPPR